MRLLDIKTPKLRNLWLQQAELRDWAPVDNAARQLLGYTAQLNSGDYVAHAYRSNRTAAGFASRDEAVTWVRGES